MKKFCLLLIALIILIGCGRKESSERVPSREAVADVSATVNTLDRPIGLAIIAATPARPGPRDPYSISEVRQHLERAKKEKAFLESLTFTSTLEDTKAKTKAFLDDPSSSNAKTLRLVLNRLVKELERDTSSKLWNELVPSTATQPISDMVSKLKKQVQAL
jgi:hypothetical protein